MPSSISSHCWSVMLPARFSAQYFQTSDPLPSGWSRQCAGQHRAGGHEDRRQVHADGAHQHRRRRLVAAAHEHRAVDRIRAKQLLGLQRQQIAIQHRRRLLEHLGQRDRRHLQRESAGLQHAAFDFLGALTEMRMAGVDVAPGVDDGDDRLADVVGTRIAHLRGARMMSELAHVVGTEPAVRAELVGFLARCAHFVLLIAAPRHARAARERRRGSRHDVRRRCSKAAASIGPMSAMPASDTASCRTRIGE